MCSAYMRAVPGVVVGSGAQDVSERVPGQTPDHALVRHLHAPHLLLHPADENGEQSGHLLYPVEVQQAVPPDHSFLMSVLTSSVQKQD